MVIWCILWSFGCIPFLFWYVLPKKIWQPRIHAIGYIKTRNEIEMDGDLIGQIMHLLFARCSLDIKRPFFVNILKLTMTALEMGTTRYVVFYTGSADYVTVEQLR
jgi:hypothetical protein